MVIQPLSKRLIKPNLYMIPSLVPGVFHFLMKDPGNEVDRTPCDVGLDSKIPKNHLKIYFNNPAKKSINLNFLSKNLKITLKIPKNLTANTLLRRLPRVLRPRATWAQVWRELLNPREVHAKKKNKDGFPFP